MGAGLLAAREGRLVLHFLRDRIGIFKITYFPAVSQLLRTGARFNRYYWRRCVALAHGSIRALLGWGSTLTAPGTQQLPELQNDRRCAIRPTDLKQIGGHAVKGGASEAPLAAGPP